MHGSSASRGGREALAAGDAAQRQARSARRSRSGGAPRSPTSSYEPFAQTEIARLEELRTVVLEERIEADLALGRHAELVSELEALVQAQPLRERPRGQLMLALYRSGRQADALAAYRAARETLSTSSASTLARAQGARGGDPPPGRGAAARGDAARRPAMQFRRLVTILFCDIVESMALAEALDAEALGRVLQSYFETVSAAITRHGGTVEKYAGDAVMAAFGIPVSHEDDALRAARAALDIRAGLAALNERLLETRVGLQVRIGLEAGEVVATPTDTRQRLVTGEAVGIAAKLEQAAGGDEIVVGEVAGRLIDYAARLEPLGALRSRASASPCTRTASSSHARRAGVRAPAGRLARRPEAGARGAAPGAQAGGRRRLGRARRSSSAPPASGKSRLAAELSRRAKGVTTLWGRCLSYGEGITYWPLREVLEPTRRRARSATRSSPRSRPRRRRRRPRSHGCSGGSARRSRASSRSSSSSTTSTGRSRRSSSSSSTSSERAKGRSSSSASPARSCSRSGRRSSKGVTTPSGSSSTRSRGRRPIALLEGLGGTVLESDQRARIVATAEGNPFFLEQLLALALEGGLGERQLPETIQALLAARLDRLGPGERAVLERGAVIGKEFRLDDVAALLEPEAAPTARRTSRRSRRGASCGPPRRQVPLPPRPRAGGGLPAAPKRLRAELHERFVDRFEGGTTSSRTSTSSPGTTSSRPTVCGRSSASPTGEPNVLPRKRGEARGGRCSSAKRGDVRPR